MMDLRLEASRLFQKFWNVRVAAVAVVIVSTAFISCGGSQDVPTANGAATAGSEQSVPAEPKPTPTPLPTPEPEPSAEPDQLREQDTNQLPTRQPLMIIHGDADEQVAIETSKLLLDQLCAFEGQAPAIRNVYPGEPHGGAVWGNAAWHDLLEWAEARFANESAPDDCKR